MAKAKKTTSGKWRMRVYNYTDENGKRYYECITRDTKAECEYAAAEFLMNGRGKPVEIHPITVGEAVDQYIELCQVLSPTTVSNYRQLRRDGFQHLMDTAVEDLDDAAMQAAINTESMRIGRRGRISAKTVKNEWGLISSALNKICHKTFNIRLPVAHKKNKEYPMPQVVMEMVRGTEIELPCLLALWLSFTMSEIRGLRWTDIHNGCIYIDRVMVDVDGVPTIKENAKTQTRIRKHMIPPYIQQLLDRQDRSSEYIVPMNHAQIYHRFERLCKKNHLDLTFHDLRHLNASVMLALGVPEKYAMERGGWKTPTVMKNVYQHTFSEQRRVVDAQIDAYFEQYLPKDM